MTACWSPCFCLLLFAVRSDDYMYCTAPTCGALIWVPGSVCAVAAVHAAGLGTRARCSSLSIIASFSWGVLASIEEVQIEKVRGIIY